MQNLVSVIVPVYRVEKYLDRCVNSICLQTYRNLEIILVDDGSDDNCPDICDRWAKKDNRIRVIHKRNGGLSDARNAGLKVASGKYVLFVDSDDYIKEETIEVLVDSMIKNNADAVSFGYTKVDENGKEIEKFIPKLERYDFVTEKEKVIYIYSVLLQYAIAWEAWNRLYRMDIIKENQLRFELNKEVFAEDMCFNLYYTLCSNNIVCIKESFYSYLIRNTSIMGSLKEQKISEPVHLSKKVEELAYNKGNKYIVKHFEYIAMCLIMHFLSFISVNEYGYYANKVEDKEYCIKYCKRVRSYIRFCKIWGKKNGTRLFYRYKKFKREIKKSNRVNKIRQKGD